MARARCPHCAQEVTIPGPTAEEAIACPFCGDHFRVVRPAKTSDLQSAEAPVLTLPLAFVEPEETRFRLVEDPEPGPTHNRRAAAAETLTGERHATDDDLRVGPPERRKRYPGPLTGWSTRAWRALIGLSLLATLLLTALVLVVRFQTRSSILANHEPALKNYLRVGGGGGTAGQPFLRGKLVTVNRGTHDLDPAFLDLPTDLCAWHPDEVQTVVFLAYEIKDTGLMIMRRGEKTGVPLLEHFCQITAVELATGQVTAQTTVSSRLNKDRYVVADQLEGKPTARVLEYLTGLPRK